MIYILISLGILPIFLTIGLVARNRVQLFDPPGLIPRLKAYLFTNIAETAPDHVFPELRTRTFQEPPEALYERVGNSLHFLHWQILSRDAAARTIKAVVTTPLLKFEDDIVIRVDEAENNSSALYIRSSSRLGRGDLGANIRHVLDVYEAMERRAE